MTENESFQPYHLNKPRLPTWRGWLAIAFGILLPVFFGTVGCLFIIASHAPLWAMAIGAIVGLGYALVGGTLDLFELNSKKMRAWLGGIAAAMLIITQRLTAEWVLPHHTVSSAFTAGYVFSWAVGIFFGTLFFNAVAARLRTPLAS